MTPKAAFAFAFTLSLLAQTHAVGCPPGHPAESPEAVARKALDAMKQERMEDFVGLMYPEALHSFREVLMSVVEAAARDGHEAYILSLFHGVDDVQQLKALEDTDFVVAFLDGVLQLQPQFRQLLTEAETQILGHVPEGQDKAHVVYRMTLAMEEAQITQLDVVSLQKSDSQWKMLFTGDIQGMAQLLKQQFADEQ